MFNFQNPNLIVKNMFLLCFFVVDIKNGSSVFIFDTLFTFVGAEGYVAMYVFVLAGLIAGGEDPVADAGAIIF